MPAATLQRKRDDRALIIKPRLPSLVGSFDLPAGTLVASHQPHEHLREHLHAHLPHMHVRYGLEIPAQELTGIDSTILEVAMAIRTEHRVDCNPIFVARSEGAESINLQVARQDVHWVDSERVSQKANRLYEESGRKLPDGFYFYGFETSDPDERFVCRYTREDLVRCIGQGQILDQHFQATWRKPKDEAIKPYDVVLYLGDSETSYCTFVRLPVDVPIGAY